MKTLTCFPALCADATGEVPLTRESAGGEPFERVAAGAAPLPFTAEILSARAELARRYNNRGLVFRSNGVRS